MRKLIYYARGIWVDQHLTQWITNIMIMVHVGLGIAIIAGGKARMSNSSYGVLKDYVHGQVWMWGCFIFLSAVLMSVPFKWANVFGLWLGMVWHIIWMAGFTIASQRYPDAATTTTPMYAGMAMICSALLTARVIDKTSE